MTSSDQTSARTDTPSGAIGKLTTIGFVAIIAFAFVGYFIGLSDGVPVPEGTSELSPTDVDTSIVASPVDKTIAAVRYDEIANTEMGPTKPFQSQLVKLPANPTLDLFQEIVPDPQAKAESGRIRASRRAYNGAPPVIPHGVQNTSDAACYSCHSGGVQMAGMKASVMSHQFLANCTQCHASPPPAPLQNAEVKVETTFVGLPAPAEGKRAYKGAPPTIPHSQWMRENCHACHSGANGWAGMETTHPWRTNCTQCHAPSAALDQAIPAETVPMLPPIDVASK